MKSFHSLLLIYKKLRKS